MDYFGYTVWEKKDKKKKMINRTRIFYLGILVVLVLSLGGCTFVETKPQPVIEKTDPLVDAKPVEVKSVEIKPQENTDKHPLTADVPKNEDQDAQVSNNTKVITNDQIEKKLFAPTHTREKKQAITRLQRPIKGLNNYKTGQKGKPGDIVINFNDASLSEVINTFAEILKIDYILEAGLKGSVTVHTAGGLHEEDIFPVFFQILEANGLTAVKEGGLYRIIQLGKSSGLPLNVHMRSDLSDLSPGERIVIQIISLDHIDVNEMIKIIKPFVSAGGMIVSQDDSNTMLLVDKGIVVLKALNLVEVFDVDTFQQKNHQFYLIKHMDAEDAVKLLADLLKAYGKSETKTTLIPIKRLNTIIGVSSDANVLEWIAGILARLDVPGYDSTPKIYVYKVQNGGCAELGSILESVFSQTGVEKKKEIATGISKKTEDKNNIELVFAGGLGTTAPKGLGAIKATGLPGVTGGNSKSKETTAPKNRVSSSSETGTDTLKGEIKISLDEVRNALIIQAYPSDYRVVKTILEQLDIMPRQVLIEVTIADITLNDKSDLGVDWTKLVSAGADGAVGKGTTSGTIGETGINFTIGLSDTWKTVLSMLASEGRVDVLSTPVLLASDNKKATIDVADDIPVVTTEYKSVTLGDDVVETSVAYRKTGLILAVTPHINDKGFVTMELSQEVSNVGDGVIAGGQEYPSFRTRNIDTVFTVNHEQTIMIGGLMSQTENKGSDGVPYLSAIPGIGWMFGKQSNSFTKTELTIFITPHVIYSMGDVDQITNEFKYRLKTIQDSKEKDNL